MHIDRSVLELPHDVQDKLSLVNASMADLTKLYQGSDNLLTLPERITQAGVKLQMPDTKALIADLMAAEAALNGASGLQQIIFKLSTLARALDRTLRDAKNNIQPSLDAFARDEAVRMDLQDTLTFEGPVVRGAAHAFESANIIGFNEAVQGISQGLTAAMVPAKREADAIPGVLRQISEFDIINNYIGPLQQAEQVYKQFGNNPANVSVELGHWEKGGETGRQGRLL